MMQLTPDEVANVVLARHRRGVLVGLLTVLTWGLWLAAAGWTLYLVLNYPREMGRGGDLSDVRIPLPDAKPGNGSLLETVDPRRVIIPDGGKIGYYTMTQTRPLTAEERIKWGMEQGSDRVNGLVWAMWQVQGILGVLLLALLSTVALLGASRRAALRQIQASLAAIAGQLAELQRAGGTSLPAAG